MAVLVKACYETAKQFFGHGVLTKIDNKEHQVYFKVYCDDSDIQDSIELFKKSNNVIMLEYQGTPLALGGVDLSGVYVTMAKDFGMNITGFDIQSFIDDIPEGVTPIIRLPQEYSDMRFVNDMCKKYQNIRFCGGTFFCLDGCNIGCCGRDILEKNKIKYDTNTCIYQGCSCALKTYSEDDVVLKEGKMQVRKSSGKSGGAKKKTLQFKELLAGASPAF